MGVAIDIRKRFARKSNKFVLKRKSRGGAPENRKRFARKPKNDFVKTYNRILGVVPNHRIHFNRKPVLSVCKLTFRVTRFCKVCVIKK